ncbi:Protein translation factor SUI1-1-like protein [Morus notabilis]|uniref:Protein translation factor SUI1-1-like protein n=1 Tax=Morus notabilis TaxID=981085 RepID=W9RRK9_9ROSA|nr:Protein translation factor SUI1-1-like protein [Morus notabilis]
MKTLSSRSAYSSFKLTFLPFLLTSLAYTNIANADFLRHVIHIYQSRTVKELGDSDSSDLRRGSFSSSTNPSRTLISDQVISFSSLRSPILSIDRFLGLSILVVRFSLINQPRFMSEIDDQIPTAFDPFAEANAEDSGAGSKEYVHIRIQQRNGRKSLTTVQGLKKEFSYNKILKDLKKEFCCNGTVVQDPEQGQVIQLQGDQRKNVSTFLIQASFLFPVMFL